MSEVSGSSFISIDINTDNSLASTGDQQSRLTKLKNGLRKHQQVSIRRLLSCCSALDTSPDQQYSPPQGSLVQRPPCDAQNQQDVARCPDDGDGVAGSRVVDLEDPEWFRGDDTFTDDITDCRFQSELHQRLSTAFRDVTVNGEPCLANAPPVPDVVQYLGRKSRVLNEECNDLEKKLLQCEKQKEAAILAHKVIPKQYANMELTFQELEKEIHTVDGLCQNSPLYSTPADLMLCRCPSCVGALPAQMVGLRNTLDSRPEAIPRVPKFQLCVDLETVKVEGSPLVIGRGNWAQIELMRLLPSNELAAVKRLQLPEAARSKYNEVVLAEVQALQAVAPHRTFPQIYGVIDEDPLTSIVMEFVGDPINFSTMDLMSVLVDQNPSLSEIKWVSLAHEVTTGLMHMHDHGYLHCDMKCDNVLLWMDRATGDWSVKIVDLGNAQPINGDNTPMVLSDSKKEEVYHYCHQVAPELVEGVTGNTVESDVFALGLILMEIGDYFAMLDLTALGKMCRRDDPGKRLSLKFLAEELTKMYRLGIQESIV